MNSNTIPSTRNTIPRKKAGSEAWAQKHYPTWDSIFSYALLLWRIRLPAEPNPCFTTICHNYLEVFGRVLFRDHSVESESLVHSPSSITDTLGNGLECLTLEVSLPQL